MISWLVFHHSLYWLNCGSQWEGIQFPLLKIILQRYKESIRIVKIVCMQKIIPIDFLVNCKVHTQLLNLWISGRIRNMKSQAESFSDLCVYALCIYISHMRLYNVKIHNKKLQNSILKILKALQFLKIKCQIETDIGAVLTNEKLL